jgi:uncharacterized alpha-E superfamily protein
VLSRIAESLYWVGRYVERADDTARILDAHVNSLVQSAGPGEIEAGSRRMMAVMGAAPPIGLAGQLGLREVVEALAYDDAQPSSISASLRAARENARGVREVISSEMWECLNATFNRIPAERSAARRRGPDPYLAFTRRQAARFAGLAESTMSRDDGWRFLVLGRSLERVDMNTRLLAAQVGRADPMSSWILLLRSCGGYEAYLRSYRGSVTPVGVVEFLLRDRLFPRSALHALTLAEEVLATLEPRTGRVGLGGSARRVVGAARADLEYAAPAEVLASLQASLADLQDSVSQAHALVATRFFRQSGPVLWSEEGAS